MRKRLLIDAERFERKVRLFRVVFDLGRDKDVSAELNAAPNTLTYWFSEDRVPKHALDRLAEMLAKLHPCTMTVEEANALWRGPYEEFEAAVFRRPLTDLLSILRRVKPALNVHLVKVAGSGFSMVDDSVEVDDSATEISINEKYCFEINGQPGKRLTLLCADSCGWRLLAPSHLHPGRIESQCEIFPLANDHLFRFKDQGLHQFLFLELPSELEPLLPRAGTLAPLDGWHLDQFAKQLTSPLWAGNWRWAGAIYKVV